MSDVRIDKWLWEVRIFKTRSQSTDAVRSCRVKVMDQSVKPSRMVRQGEIITVQFQAIVKTIKVVDFPDHRVGARLVEQYMEDLTPQSEYDKLKIKKELGFEYRQKGTGRPTKRERRIIEILKKQWGE